MSTSVLSSSTTELSKTTLHSNFSDTIYVKPNGKIFFKNFFQIEKEFKDSHLEYVLVLGPGPFVIEKITFCLDNGICLEFYDKKGEYQSIDKNYFSRGVFIRIFWSFWKFLRGFQRFIIYE